jgi:hypothetical protein
LTELFNIKKVIRPFLHDLKRWLAHFWLYLWKIAGNEGEGDIIWSTHITKWFMLYCEDKNVLFSSNYHYWKYFVPIVIDYCADKHNILMSYYVGNVLHVSYHSFVILYVRDALVMWTFLSSMYHMYIFLFFTLFSSRLVLSCFLFPLCVLYIKHRSVLEEYDWKNGIALLTSYISRIAVTLLLQFVFVITNNTIKCCNRNESFYPLFHHLFNIRYNIYTVSIYVKNISAIDSYYCHAPPITMQKKEIP